MKFKYAFLLPIAVAVSGCAETHLITHAWKKINYEEAGYSAPAITGKRKIGNPYTVLGKTYYPIDSSEGYRRKGIASWYGKDFHGKKTANGEVYNMYDMTAAHPTLPLPTYVRVTNLENGRAIIVRVNDRGPFLRGRAIDLSFAAATQLDMAEQGTAPVLLEALPTNGSALRVTPTVKASPKQIAEKATVPKQRWTDRYSSKERFQQSTFTAPKNPVKAPSPLPTVDEVSDINPQTKVTVGGPVEIYVQTGAFGDIKNALRQRDELRKTYNNVVVQETLKGSRALHRVRIGPLTGVGESDQVLNQIISAGWHNARIVVD